VRLKADAIQLNCEPSPKSWAIHGKALAILDGNYWLDTRKKNR
jgi:hypothetical protein